MKNESIRTRNFARGSSVLLRSENLKNLKSSTAISGPLSRQPAYQSPPAQNFAAVEISQDSSDLTNQNAYWVAANTTAQAQSEMANARNAAAQSKSVSPGHRQTVMKIPGR